MRVTALLALLTIQIACSSTTTDAAKLESVYRAGKSIEAAVDTGVTLPTYRALVQSLATEISIARDKATTDAARAIVKHYDDALVAYKDALTLWDLNIENSLNQTDYVLAIGPTLEALMSRNDLRVDAAGGLPRLEVAPARAAIWKRASGHLAAGYRAQH